jgi:c-di-GMP-binding flagellar brake protein YcgR
MSAISSSDDREERVLLESGESQHQTSRALSTEPEIEPIDTTDLDLEHFRIRSAREMEAILSRLAERATVVSLHVHNSPWFMLTTVVRADYAANLLQFEYGRDEELNARVLQSTELRFDTYQDQINVRFIGRRVRETMVLDTPLFECDFPDTLLRLQRREFFRIAPPLNQPITIRLPLSANTRRDPAAGASFASDTQVVEMHARGIDISCGGVVFLVEGNFMHTPVGSVLFGAELELAGTATLKLDLEVRNLRFVEMAGHRGTTRIGCRFSRIDSRASAQLQRYINRLQIERRV